MLKKAATVGLEPTTNRLTAYCSTTLLGCLQPLSYVAASVG
jgi:hypothetical protein